MYSASALLYAVCCSMPAKFILHVLLENSLSTDSFSLPNMRTHSCSWLGVVIYLVVLFSVTVVLRNILVAQFSKSYKEMTERAQINVILTKTVIILKMEQSVVARHLVRVSALFVSLFKDVIPCVYPYTG